MTDSGSGGTGPSPERLQRSASTNRRLLSWGSLTVASRVLSKLTQLLFLVAAARILSVEEFASYSYLLVLAITFAMLGDTGVAMVGSRDVSAGRRTAADTYWSAFPAVALCALLAALGMVVFGTVGSGPGSSPGLIALAAAFVGVNVLFSFGTTMLRGVGRPGVEAAIQGAGAIAFAGGAIGLASAGFGLEAVLAVLLAKEVISGLTVHLLLRPEVGPPTRRDRSAWQPLLLQGLRLGLASTALAVATRSELILLGNLGEASDVAWFSAPLRITEAVLVFSLTAGYALLPGATYLSVTDRGRVTRLVWRLLGAVTAVGAIVALACALAAEPILTLLFGETFSPAAAPGAILLAGIPAYGALGIVWYALLAFDGDRELMGMAVALGLFSLVAGALVIPAHDDVGAAWVYVVTLTAMAATGALLLRRCVARGGTGVPDRETLVAAGEAV